MPKTSCPHCGKSNPPRHKFCGECGGSLSSRATPAQRLATADAPADAAPALEGERKHVTVLITDIKGSLEMLADRDPEDANRLLDAVLRLMMEAVHRYDGTVSQTRGDGMLAMFGAPLALEDHAVRACLAALAIQHAVNALSERTMIEDGIGVQVRVGLNSGEVVARPMRNDHYTEYSAVGQTVHLAGRMEQLALPGKIFATAQTVRLAEHHVDARALGPVQVRGLSGTVEVYEITGAEFAGVRSRFASGHLTPFVGRQAQMEALQGALLDAEAGMGLALTIVGEAGVGKSRLIHEFLQMTENAEWRVIESNLSGQSGGRAYAPFIELLRINFRIDENDGAQQIRDKLESRLLQPGQNFPVEDVAALLGLFDALPAGSRHLQLDTQQQRHAVFRAVTRLVHFESRRQPLVIVMEHLDQNDNLSMQLLAELLSQIREERVLVLCTQRQQPGDQPGSLVSGQVLRMQPLEPQAFHEFMDGLLGDDPSLRPIKPFLREHALGNPFFAEEITRALADAGVLTGRRGRHRLAGPLPEIQLPDTLQALLAARIDRVPTDDKRILQCAAVAGSQVTLGLLRAITDLPQAKLRQSLQRLVQAELLVESRLYPEAEYRFANRLTHEVAYNELLRSQRGALHAQIVEAIERLYAHRLSEWLEPLANHAFHAQQWEKAVRYLREAAWQARERHAHADADLLFTRALQAADQIQVQPRAMQLAIDLRLEFRSTLELLGEQARCDQYLREAGQMAASLQDLPRSGLQKAQQAWHHCLLGHHALGMDGASEALQIAEAHQLLPLQVTARGALGLLHHAQGHFTQAAQCFEWNVARLQGEHLGQRFGMSYLPAVHARAFLAWSQAELGDFRHAHSTAQMAERLAVELNHPPSHSYALMVQGVVHLRQGEIVRAVLALQQAMGVPGAMDNPLLRAYAGAHLGVAMALAQRQDEGLTMLERCTALAHTHGFVAHQAQRLAYLAEAQLRAGREDQAMAVAERALHLARQHGEQAGEAYARSALAECALQRGRLQEASERFLGCLEQATQLRMLPLQAHCHDGLARVAEGSSDFSLQRTHRTQADALAEAMDMQPWPPPLPQLQSTTWLPQRHTRH